MSQAILKYPIILIHGTGARDNSLFWGRIPKTLLDNHVPFYYGKTDPWGSVTTNAVMLKSNLAKISESNSIEKFNLIAHSKGGIDARYMISQLDKNDMVASLTTISTPHLGTPIADYILDNYLKRQTLSKLILQTAFLFGGQSPEPIELIRNLSVLEMRSFNHNNKDKSNVYYQSFGSTMHSPQDDPLYALSFKYLKKNIGDNDGMIPLENAKWGEKFQHIRSNKGISHAGLTDIKRRSIGNLNIPQIYLDIVRHLADNGF